MSAEELSGELKQPPRRRLGWGKRISLAGLLFLVFCFALIFGWIAIERGRFQTEQRALKRLHSIGGEAITSADELFVQLDPIIGPEWSESILLVGFAEGSEIGDEELKLLLDLRSVDHLNLSTTKVTDSGMETLTHVRGLTSIDLSQTSISDHGVAHLAKIKTLRDVRLAGTDVTVDGLKKLNQLPELENLDIRGTTIGKKGLIEVYGPKGPPFMVSF